MAVFLLSVSRLSDWCLLHLHPTYTTDLPTSLRHDPDNDSLPNCRGGVSRSTGFPDQPLLRNGALGCPRAWVLACACVRGTCACMRGACASACLSGVRMRGICVLVPVPGCMRGCMAMYVLACVGAWVRAWVCGCMLGCLRA